MKRNNKQPIVDKEKRFLQGFNLIAAEIGKHGKEDSFAMDCPFCGAAQGLEIHISAYSVAGRCSACGTPVHIKRVT